MTSFKVEMYGDICHLYFSMHCLLDDLSFNMSVKSATMNSCVLTESKRRRSKPITTAFLQEGLEAHEKGESERTCQGKVFYNLRIVIHILITLKS